MKKFIFSLILIGSFGLYIVFQNRLNPKSVSTLSSNNLSITNSNRNITGISNSNRNEVTNTNTNRTTTATANGQYSDGSYTGEEASHLYGTVQVQAIVSNGKLTDIKFLQYPQDRPNSVKISNYSLPILKSEAIASQSAVVDTVSGATETSQAFRKSLTSALQKAS